MTDLKTLRLTLQTLSKHRRSIHPRSTSIFSMKAETYCRVRGSIGPGNYIRDQRGTS